MLFKKKQVICFLTEYRLSVIATLNNMTPLIDTTLSSTVTQFFLRNPFLRMAFFVTLRTQKPDKVNCMYS